MFKYIKIPTFVHGYCVSLRSSKRIYEFENWQLCGVIYVVFYSNRRCEIVFLKILSPFRIGMDFDLCTTIDTIPDKSNCSFIFYYFFLILKLRK